jgi:hypothetical protein
MIVVVGSNAMNRIVVDTSIRSRLDNLDSPLELCDEIGVTLGYFVPAAERRGELYQWARTAFSDEAIDQSRREPGGSTTEEVLTRLRDR